MSETFPPDERGNPNPGNWTVQLRDPSVVKDKSVWPEYVGLESIHQLQAKDTKYQQFTEQFVKSMTPDQQRAARRTYDRNKKLFGEDARPYDQWLRDVQAQEYIRGGIFTKAIPGWIGPKGEGGYTSAQMKLLDQIKQYLQTSD